MASLNCSGGNCGIAEIYGLGSPVNDVLRLAQSYNGRYAHIWFSDADNLGNAARIEQVILSNGLGPVVRSCSAVNPNTKNAVTAYVWTPNAVALNKYLVGAK